MGAVAEFLRSPAGQLYVMSCERYGADPGAIASNDYVGFNIRLGAMYVAGKEQKRRVQDEPSAVENAKVVTDLEQQIRGMLGGR